jgi:hypothetical protein
MAERRLPRGLLDPESQAIAEAYEAIPSVRRQTRGLLSLDPQEEQGMGQTAIEMLASFIPGVGQLLAGRDIERARRAGDPAAAAMAATEFLPFGRLAGMMRRPGPIMSELDVYHGSPHRFEEFDASKIGTGEGAQAYGHGIYLAESPAVGRQYAEFLASRKNDLLDPGNLAASMMYRTSEGTKEAGLREIDAALKGIKNYPNSYPDAPQQKAALEKARELLESGAELPKQGGNFYTADLPDEMVDRMLDWDKPLSEQSDFVKKALGVAEGYFAVPLSSGEKMYAHGKSMAGVDLINELTSLMGEGNKVAASEYLRSRGIPGIRYLDAGSRGQGGSGTRNFVVFPGEEKKVKILKRE